MGLPPHDVFWAPVVPAPPETSQAVSQAGPNGGGGVAPMDDDSGIPPDFPGGKGDANGLEFDDESKGSCRAGWTSPRSWKKSGEGE